MNENSVAICPAVEELPKASLTALTSSSGKSRGSMRQ